MNIQADALAILAANGTTPEKAHGYDLAMPTPLGVLRATVYRDWVAMAFDNAKLAHSRLDSVNPLSGKWNWYIENENELGHFQRCIELLPQIPPPVENELNA